ncbi:MAG: hypothetical protein WD098_12145 [Balneolales bacterium]
MFVRWIMEGIIISKPSVLIHGCMDRTPEKNRQSIYAVPTARVMWISFLRINSDKCDLLYDMVDEYTHLHVP